MSVPKDISREMRPVFWGMGVLLVLLTFFAFGPSLRGGFVWDDNVYVTQNPLLTASDGLSRIWFSTDQPSQYFPMVYTILRIEYQLWGMNPFGYHLVNLLLHAINAILVWRILRSLAIPGAWFGAALFALHPVQVESVAWITELKNILSTFFYLLAVRAWLIFITPGTKYPRWWYLGVLGFYLIALLSKTTACTLPAVLLLLLWYQHKPIDSRRILQIFPLFIFGLIMGLVSIWMEHYHMGTRGMEFDFTPADRVIRIGRALWFYVGKLLWPYPLIFSYPRWEIHPENASSYAWTLAAILFLLVLGLGQRAWGRGPLTAMLFHALVLAPLLGFFSLYTFRYTFVADHYQYLASVGPLALFAAFLTLLTQRWRRARIAIFGAIFGIFGGLSHLQSTTYHNTETLWQYTLKQNPDSWMAHNNLGILLAQNGYPEQAEVHYKTALKLNPDYPEAHNNLGKLLEEASKNDEALAHYRAALKGRPDSFEMQRNLGVLLLKIGHSSEGIAFLMQTLKQHPENANEYNHLAATFAQDGKFEEAVALQTALIHLSPSAQAYNNLGIIRIMQGNPEEAIHLFQQALKLDPNMEEAAANLKKIQLISYKTQSNAHSKKFP